MDAVNGTSKTLRVKREVICDKCEGKKVQPVDQNKNDCLTCYGTGDDFQNIGDSCRSCNGSGL